MFIHINPPRAKDLTFSSTLSCNKGFTLVELSIVLLVIGLLVSGVLVGKDMIRAAELRSITTQKDQLQSSVMLFQDKYQGLPGDLKNATAFWGEMGAINGGAGVCSNTAAGASGATGTQTCNGRGDGKIGFQLNYPDTPQPNSNPEHVLFWQHLSNAEMIEGKYSGIMNANYCINKQQDYVTSAGACWINQYIGTIGAADGNRFEGKYGNELSVNFRLTPSEAWNIDAKLDDGLSGLGKIVTSELSGVNCNTTNVAATANYNLTYQSPACGLIFKNMW